MSAYVLFAQFVFVLELEDTFFSLNSKKKKKKEIKKEKKKLYVINAHNMTSLEISIHLWRYHNKLCHRPVHQLQKILPAHLTPNISNVTLNTLYFLEMLLQLHILFIKIIHCLFSYLLCHITVNNSLHVYFYYFCF